MIGKILVILIVLFLGLFAFCSCKVASWSDEQIDKWEEKDNEKKNL